MTRDGAKETIFYALNIGAIGALDVVEELLLHVPEDELSGVLSSLGLDFED